MATLRLLGRVRLCTRLSCFITHHCILTRHVLPAYITLTLWTFKYFGHLLYLHYQQNALFSHVLLQPAGLAKPPQNTSAKRTVERRQSSILWRTSRALLELASCQVNLNIWLWHHSSETRSRSEILYAVFHVVEMFLRGCTCKLKNSHWHIVSK